MAITKKDATKKIYQQVLIKDFYSIGFSINLPNNNSVFN